MNQILVTLIILLALLGSSCEERVATPRSAEPPESPGVSTAGPGPSGETPPPEAPGPRTPGEALVMFQKAAEAEDWGRAFGLFTKKSLDRMVFGLVAFLTIPDPFEGLGEQAAQNSEIQKAIEIQGKFRESIARSCQKRGISEELIRELDQLSGSEGLEKITARIQDPAAFAGEVFASRDSSVGGPLPLEGAREADIVVDEETGMATVNDSVGMTYRFQLENGTWKIHGIPEQQEEKLREN